MVQPASVVMLAPLPALVVLKIGIRKEKKNWRRVGEVEERSRERKTCMQEEENTETSEDTRLGSSGLL